jgi:nucleotide-binding universal stress UspA family protein
MKAVVPLDGSDTALGIMPSVRRLIEMSPGIEIHLLRVMDPKDVRGRLEHVVGEPPAASVGKTTVQAPPPRLVESHGEAMARKGIELREGLEAVAAKEIPQAASVAHVKWSGNAAQAITELANELDADVIVMATHGRSGISHVLAGSVAEAVIRTSGRPVLVQKPG